MRTMLLAAATVLSLSAGVARRQSSEVIRLAKDGVTRQAIATTRCAHTTRLLCGTVASKPVSLNSRFSFQHGCCGLSYVTH
jgi:hypothetical protein